MVSQTAAYSEAAAVGVDSEVGCGSTVAEIIQAVVSSHIISSDIINEVQCERYWMV